MKNWSSYRCSQFGAIALVALLFAIVVYLETKRPMRQQTSASLATDQQNRHSKQNRTRDSRLRDHPKSIQGLESLLLHTPLGAQHREIIYQLATAYAKEDPDGGIRWLASLPHSLENRIVFTVFASTLALSDPNKAKELFSSVDSAYGKQAYFNGVITACGKIDPRGTWEFYLRSRGELPDAKQGMDTALSEMKDDDLTTWQSLKLIATKENDLLSYFQNFQISSLETGFELIETIGSGEHRSKAVRGLVKKWPVDRLDELEKYARSQELSASNDTLFAALVEKIYTNDPVKAAEWLKHFSDTKIKEASSTLILNYAQSQDPVMAEKIKILVQADPP